ncbi:MAG: sodium-translocating pyrophosphatase, partial [Nanoarchaeota archaeon]
AVYVIVVAILLGIFIQPRGVVGLVFVIGALLSSIAGNVGMRIATQANARTTNAARTSLERALQIAFSSGAVMGLTVVSLGLLGISFLFMWHRDPSLLFGFGFGASSIALFARVGGGIYTKAADVGADLVGKIEAGIPEDDPRNPATIADNVGDNVGDVAGMGADLFESFVGSIIAAMMLGGLMIGELGAGTVLYPLFIAAAGVVASIIGTFFVRAKGDPARALHTGLWAASILLAIGAFFITKATFATLGPFWAIISGLVTGILIGLFTDYYTSHEHKPTQQIANASKTGPATVIIEGMAVGMMSTVLPIIVICIAIWMSYTFAGIYGIALAGVGMLSTLGISLAIDAYGPVADNAGGIAEMSGLPHEVRERTDTLDALGNTTAAMGKGFAIGSAALTALALMTSFMQQANPKVGSSIALNVNEPVVLIGLFIGALLPFVFASLTMKAVGEAAMKMVEEVRHQFKTIKGLMQGKAKPDYARCVDIATKGALHQMILPGLLAIVVPVAVGMWSIYALGGLLVGATVTGVLLAIFMANAGGAWDNAKKYIESGKLGGKGSDAHKAAVVGDTVGDPFKDTSGPSLNILIKLMSMVAVVCVPLFLH